MRKLQINEAGAWRMVLSYPEERDIEVRAYAVKMVLFGNPHAKIRVLDEWGHVLWYWESGAGWYKPALAARRGRP
ncbi:hypothetical protein Tgr7_0420 [Thioalkalivibrio sulfidiphilus HL-EbGr7]|uniref:Uncharacterized protein n=1 Tax=Thioalkalivibrio sulfidiphilus (strain HL-EbGR7) TaxID=396588 RepID=B8GL00_THISH|nr:hypothetical protein [Thioalkalivibrio sulfidiphilus]ACL71518.1 hypothetical protein Tgr7_0420 [Thioalkalivibrio sulfidiphilus HL-EbGr7]